MSLDRAMRIDERGRFWQAVNRYASELQNGIVTVETIQELEAVMAEIERLRAAVVERLVAIEKVEREAAEKMRERCAREVSYSASVEEATRLRAAIRALEVTP